VQSFLYRQTLAFVVFVCTLICHSLILLVFAIAEVSLFCPALATGARKIA